VILLWQEHVVGSPFRTRRDGQACWLLNGIREVARSGRHQIATANGREVQFSRLYLDSHPSLPCMLTSSELHSAPSRPPPRSRISDATAWLRARSGRYWHFRIVAGTDFAGAPQPCPFRAHPGRSRPTAPLPIADVRSGPDVQTVAPGRAATESAYRISAPDNGSLPGLTWR
jgi:hypothetical protein